MTEWKAKRFWTAVDVVEVSGGFTIRLDDRPVKTPLKSDLIVPSRALAQGIAAEWDAQAEVIAPLTMPLTRAANTAIEKVLPHQSGVVDELARYGETDLICYRATGPDSLVARQAAGWDPLLDWARGSLGAGLVPVAGIMPQGQPEAALARLRGHLAAIPAWELVALSEFVTLSGSLILGLAAHRGERAIQELWDLSRIDEIWQQEQWGEDEEEAERIAGNRAAFLQAETYLTQLRAG